MTGFCECGCGGKTKISPVTDASHGYVKGQPRRFIKGHAHIRYAETHIEEDRGHGSSCWMWQGATSGHYGWARKTDNRRATFAHVAAYMDALGPIPEGMAVHHLCGVKKCVNPTHLTLLTHAEHRRTHKNAKRPSRLSPEQVRFIRERTDISLWDHSVLVGLDYSYVCKVRKGLAPKEL